MKSKFILVVVLVQRTTRITEKKELFIIHSMTVSNLTARDLTKLLAVRERYISFIFLDNES